MKSIVLNSACNASVVDIKWERIFLTIEVKLENLQSKDPVTFYLVDEEGNVKGMVCVEMEF